jgi:hypothetical protein
MPNTRRPVPPARKPCRPVRTRRAAAVLAAAALAVPVAPPAAASATCTGVSFTARSEADLVKVSVLDPGALGRDLPAVADVRLAAAHSAVDSTGTPHRAVATGRYADARLLGMQMPGLPLPDTAAVGRAPGGGGTAAVTLARLDAGGLAAVQSGKSTAEAHWDAAYACGGHGPLTRAATMLAGVSLLGGGSGVPGMQAVDRTSGAARPTSLLRIGPTGSTQSAADVVRLGDGRRGVRAGAGVALSDLALFAGTPQEISLKVVTQPTLTVVAGGSKARSRVTYRPAVLAVMAGGEPVATMDSTDAGVSLSLRGRLSGDRSTALLTVRLSLGGPTQEITGDTVRAEAAALRLEVRSGRTRLLDVAVGHLSAEASLTSTGTPGPDQPEPPRQQPDPEATGGSEPTTAAPTAAAPTAVEPTTAAPTTAAAAPVAEPAAGSGGGDALALTGANVALMAGGGATLLVLGIAALLLTRRRNARGSTGA